MNTEIWGDVHANQLYYPDLLIYLFLCVPSPFPLFLLGPLKAKTSFIGGTILYLGLYFWNSSHPFYLSIHPFWFQQFHFTVSAFLMKYVCSTPWPLTMTQWLSAQPSTHSSCWPAKSSRHEHTTKPKQQKVQHAANLAFSASFLQSHITVCPQQKQGPCSLLKYLTAI